MSTAALGSWTYRTVLPRIKQLRTAICAVVLRTISAVFPRKLRSRCKRTMREPRTGRTHHMRISLLVLHADVVQLDVEEPVRSGIDSLSSRRQHKWPACREHSIGRTGRLI